MTGQLGRTFNDQEWSWLFRVKEELVVVKVGPWWQTPAHAAQ